MIILNTIYKEDVLPGNTGYRNIRISRVKYLHTQSPCLHEWLVMQAFDEQREREKRSFSSLLIRQCGKEQREREKRSFSSLLIRQCLPVSIAENIMLNMRKEDNMRVLWERIGKGAGGKGKKSAPG